MTKVTVTQEDITTNGVGAFACPIALAINRSLPKLKAEVGPWRVKLWDDYTVIGNYPLCKATYDFVRLYDNGREVEPFEFEFPYNDDTRTSE